MRMPIDTASNMERWGSYQHMFISRAKNVLKTARLLKLISLTACVLLIALCVAPHAFASSAQRRASAAGPSSPAEQLIFVLANQERQKRGIAPLAWDANLAAAARMHAMRMAKANTISHQLAGEADLGARAMQSGAHFSVVAENVAMAPSAAMIHDEWMHSPGHRANLLDPRLDALGVAVVQQGGELFAVQDFSRRVQVMNYAQQEQQVEGLLAARGMAVLQDSADARKSCAMADGYAGNRRPLFTMHYTTTNLSLLPDALASKLRSEQHHQVAVGACASDRGGDFSYYNIAVLVY